MSSFSILFRVLVALTLLAPEAYGASLQTVKDWGDNPSGISQMQIYVPDKLAAKPAIILGVRSPSLKFAAANFSLLVTPLRWHRTDVLPDDKIAKIRRPAWVHSDIPNHHKGNELLGLPFKQDPRTRRWRGFSRPRQHGEIRPQQIQRGSKNGVFRGRVIGRDDDQCAGSNIPGRLQCWSIMVRGPSCVLVRLANIDACVV